MRFATVGEFVCASRISGPRHHYLQLKLADARLTANAKPEFEALPPQGGCVHEPFDVESLIASVLEGVAKVNEVFGTSYAVVRIRVPSNDTGPATAYGALAFFIIENLMKTK